MLPPGLQLKLVKVMWSIGEGSEILREYSNLFDFHLKLLLCMHSYRKIINLKCA